MFDFENQIIIGTILGGSSLVKPPKGKNYYLSMRGQNENWLKYKMAEMPSLFQKNSVRLYGKTYRANSSCSKSLSKIKKSLYDENRRIISMEILDRLRDIGLAVWYLDGGSKTGRERKNAYINTTKFGKDGSQIIQKYFSEVGMNCTINKDGERTKVLFSVEGTEVLFKTIAHRFPSFMYYKLK